MNNEINFYKVTGNYSSKGENVKFRRYYRAVNEEDVKEKIFLHFGSKHKIRRQIIKFESIDKISKEEFDNPQDLVLSEVENFQLIK